MIRKLAIKLLKIFNPGTIKIRHHLTRKPFYLDAFLHKGYWYYGAKRERDTINLFNEIVPDCNFLIDIGANIGYFSVHFCELTMDSQQLIIFEPTPNNLKYLRKNINQYKSIRLVEKAVSNKNGKANFYTENLTGQNNSLLSNYKGFNSSLKNSGVNAEKKIIEVDTITIDSYIEQEFPNENPDFIKIDIEGAELFALQGMKKTIESSFPTFMIEVSENRIEILQMFQDLDYVIISAQKSIITLINNQIVFNQHTKHVVGSDDNVFCIHKSKHDLLKKLKIQLN